MKILVISTHPDDETLGCGGTLLKRLNQGDSLYWLIATSTWTPGWSKEMVEQKSCEIDKVANTYNMEKVFRLGFPATKMAEIVESQLIGQIREVVSEVKPEIIYMIHGGDIHSDHRYVFEATMAVTKPFYMGSYGIKKILSYETLSSTEASPPGVYTPFLPQIFTEISDFLDEKIEIMKLYASEVHEDPSPRGPSAIRALARYRGATIGVDYAEAFMLLREVD